MNFDVTARTILRVRHGSQAYGTNTPTSDLDIKGVCIEPLSHLVGFLHRFDQYEKSVAKGHEQDEVIYSLKKFASLAADCNPNIIEVLHVDDSDVLFCDEFGEELRSHRDKFLSRRAKHTFSGYAHAQLKRIKTHREWLLNPPQGVPDRKDFGLSDTQKVSASELGAFESVIAQGIEVELPKGVLTLFVREKAYQAKKTHYDQYQNWVKSRNPARAELEAKYGFDTKHGMHLLRLMRMCEEIMTTGKVLVRRPDAKELLAIRYGSMNYDALIEAAEKIEARCAELYERPESEQLLPKEPDRVFLDDLVVDMTLRYYKRRNA